MTAPPITAPPSDDDRPLSPEQAKIVARMRWLMLVSGLATFLGIAVVIGVIGYRFSRGEGSVPAVGEVTALLPKGARVVSSAVDEGHLVLSIDVGGATEIRTFDLRTLRQTGRLRFATEP